MFCEYVFNIFTCASNDHINFFIYTWLNGYYTISRPLLQFLYTMTRSLMWRAKTLHEAHWLTVISPSTKEQCVPLVELVHIIVSFLSCGLVYIHNDWSPTMDWNNVG